MKKMIVLLLLVFVAGVSFGTIVSTQGEAKIAKIIKKMSSICSRADTALDSKYTEAKNYVTAYPSQFTASDKTKLNGLQTHIVDVKTELISLVAYINTEFPGVVD